MDRRKSIKALSIASLGAATSLSFNAPLSTTSTSNGAAMVFRGDINNDGAVLALMLHSNDTALFNNEVSNIRSQHTFHSRFSAKQDKFMWQPARGIVDYFLYQGNLSISFKALMNFKDETSPISFTEKRLVLTQSLGTSLNVPSATNLSVKPESTWGPSQDFHTGISDSAGFNLQVVRPVDSELVQVADLLSGLLYAYFYGNSNNLQKVYLANYLAQNSGMSETISSGSFLGGRLNMI